MSLEKRKQHSLTGWTLTGQTGKNIFIFRERFVRWMRVITCNYVSYSASETLVKYISHSREISAESESPQPARSDQFSITATRVSLPFPPSSRTRQVFLVFHDLCQTWRRSFLSGKFRHQGRICSGIQLTSLGLPPTPPTPSQAGLSCPFYEYY